jgi:hypothetical protein
MARLILVPQYPTKLRYQQWWWHDFQQKLSPYFDLIVLGAPEKVLQSVQGSDFAPMKKAIDFELQQIQEYMTLDLLEDDILLLNDIGFPGLFAQVLLHKRPKKCYAICHATAKNRFDYFAADRKIKYPIEKHIAQLFNTIFIGSEYHKRKLGWPNICVSGLPFPFVHPLDEQERIHDIVCVSRPTKQKRNKRLEKLVETFLHRKIIVPNAKNWAQYESFLHQSKIMLITATEETFGYQVIDALQQGCIPVAPNKLSYPEILPKQCLYDTEKEMLTILMQALAGQLECPALPKDNFYEILINTIQ